MYLLPNHNLAGFLGKQLFAEKRCVFVDKKTMKVEKSTEGSEGKSPVGDALKEIGQKTRNLVDGIDTEGNFGIAGTSRRVEAVAENAEMTIDDLLREKGDLDDMLNGVEMRKEDFENNLGYELLGGKDGLPVKIYQNFDNVTAKYENLQKIRAGIAGQSKSTETVNEAIRLYREEIIAEREEYLEELRKERKSILDKIEAKLANEKSELEQKVFELKSICAEPEDLKEESELDQDIGFFDDLEKKSKLDALLSKIRSGKFDDEEVLKMQERIEFFKDKVDARKKSLTELADLYRDDQAKQEFAQKVSKNVQEVLAHYCKESTEEADPAKIPQNPAEQKIVETLFDFKAKLHNPKLPVHDIVAIDDSLTRFAENLKVLRSNGAVFEELKKFEEKFANQNYAEVQTLLQNEIQQGLDTPTLFYKEGRELQNHIKTQLQTVSVQLTDASLLKFAFEQNIPKEKITDATRKSWLLSKLMKVRKLNENLQKAESNGQENMAKMRAQMEVNGFVADLKNADKDPLEVVKELEEKGNLEILPASTFQLKFKDTGITNSYFVIETNDYSGDFAKYQKEQTEWKIYLDQSFYEKIQKGEANENEKKRFRARMAHELGHREFDAYKGQELKNSGIYENSGWSQIKADFLALNPEKKVGENGQAVDFTDEEILNEIWAFYKEHEVAYLQGKYGKFIEKFDDFYVDLLGGKKVKKLRGAEAGTSEAEEEEEGDDKKTKTLSEVSDKQIEERILFQNDFNNLKKLIENLGGVFPDEVNNSDKKEPSQLVQKFNSTYPEGKALLQEFIQKRWPSLQKVYDNLHNSERKDVAKAQNQVYYAKSHLEQISEELHENEKSSQKNYFKDLWDNTRFLSFDDLNQMVKECWEFAQRRRKRRADDGRATVGQEIFGETLLGNEYFSKKQKIEMDEVNNYQGNIKNMGHEQIYPLLYDPNNKDYLKAVIIELCKRGRMRWDDPRIWNSIERFSFIHIPDKERASNDISYRNEWLKKIVTGIWDENTWDEWIKTNDSGLKSACSNLHIECEDIHANGAGAVVKELTKILDKYRKVSANFGKENDQSLIYPSHHYQKILDFAFEKGKLNMEDKFYFLIEGVTQRVIPVEYLKKIQSERFGVLPLLDFFYGKNNTYSSIKKLSDEIHSNGGYPNGVHKLIFQKVMTDKQVQTRVRKRITTNPKDIDHDDWQCIFALTTASMADELLTRQGGGNALISGEGLYNSYTSSPTFLKAQYGLLESGKKEEINFAVLANLMSSFVIFDGIWMQRYAPTGRSFQKFDQGALDYKPQGGKYSVSQYQASMYKFIGEILKRYDPVKGEEDAKNLFVATNEMDEKKKKEVREKTATPDTIASFDTRINEIIKDDRGKDIILEVLKEQGAGLPSYIPLGSNFNYKLGRNNRGDA